MGTYYVANIPYSSDELYHHGILGQKWGVRRFENADGTLTEAGKARYSRKTTRKGYQENLNRLDKDLAKVRIKKQKLENKEKSLTENDEKAAKKIEKIESKINKYNNSINDYKNLANSIIDDATSKGYSVQSKPVTRKEGLGKRHATAALLSAAYIGVSSAAFPVFYPIAGASLSVGTGIFTPLAAAGSLAVKREKVSGTKYKVKNPGYRYVD